MVSINLDSFRVIYRLEPTSAPGVCKSEIEVSHLSENCLLNHDEACEAKVQKFGETRERNFKYGIATFPAKQFH